jgi:hypothetical protein
MMHRGQKTTADENGQLNVSKGDLVSTMKLLMGTSRLKVVKDHPYSAILIKEIVGYKYRITEALNMIFGTWRENEHDDLLFSLGMCVWWAQQKGPPAADAGSDHDDDDPGFRRIWRDRNRPW